MKSLLFLIIFTGSTTSHSQTVQSSCFAPDSVVELYKEDAVLLTMRRIYDYEHTYKDSLRIPEYYIDTVLNAMIAVHNVISIPERDSVIYLYIIKPNYDIDMHGFSISADDELPWMNQLELGNTISGFQLLDNIVSENGFVLDDYNAWSWGYHTAFFKTDSTYNMRPILNILNASPEINYAHNEMLIFDNSDIEHTVNMDHVELRYILRWGDCLSGCDSERTYVFKVYYDCSVEFIESYGDQPPPSYVSLKNADFSSIFVTPNPFEERISINGLAGSFSYQINDLSGKVVVKSVSKEFESIDLSLIQNGSYLLQIEQKETMIQKKIVKM